MSGEADRPKSKVEFIVLTVLGSVVVLALSCYGGLAVGSNWLANNGFFYPVTPTFNRIGKYESIAIEHRSELDPSWDEAEFADIAGPPKFMNVCDIWVQWYEPGNDVLRVAFLTDLGCVERSSLHVHGRALRVVIGESGSERVESKFVSGIPQDAVEWESLVADGMAWEPARAR